jgi:integrase/recombinase XerD
MTRAIRLYLPKSAWPEVDQALWSVACTSGTDPFEDHGSAAHVSPRTRQQLEYAYGKFLAFVSDRHPELLKRPPAERLSRSIIEDYVSWQPKTCGGVTLAIYLYHLWLILGYICSNDDWSWLLTIGKRIAAQAKRKPEQHHLVTSETLYKLGVDLMGRVVTRVDETNDISITDALQYRNGFIIAFLAILPVRRRTLTALRIGKHLVQSGNQWSLDIPAEDIKTKRALEYGIPAMLAVWIDLYVNKFRPRIPGAGMHDLLWASNRGRPMRDGIIYVTVRQCTRKALGFPVNLHRFRTAAATFWSTRDPANVRGVKDLLGHASFATTEKHYIMAQSRLAGRSLARVIEPWTSCSHRK